MPFVQYLAAIILDHRHRGRGLGRELLDLAMADAWERSGRKYVAWAVHPENLAMLSLSTQVVPAFGIDPEIGFVLFVEP